MSNDLISRSAVIDIIEGKRLSAGKHNLSVEYALADLQEKIEKLNTAYDVDKVMEQIKDKGKAVCCSVKCNDNCNDCEHGCLMNGILKSVKAGGVSEDN